ncbi:esterase/lipase family protein [Micromonospora sp. DT81.3]|uniref:esterase/lipase family protein n=1 Tax=Micromonospora sp. DT81.3 TaxID=3416523 RepID=UPI003CF79566
MSSPAATFGSIEIEPNLPEDRRTDREVILLLHGTGGKKEEWTFPAWRGHNYDLGRPAARHSNDHLTPPLNFLPDFSLSDKKDVKCWRSVLLGLGHTIINYSQDDPSGPIEFALSQFEDLIVPFIRAEVLTGELASKRVTIIAHSRGGILARYYLARHPEGEEWIGRIVTLCSPHNATNAPNAARRLRDELSVLLAPLLAPDPLLLLLAALARMEIDVEPTAAQAQLLPGSDLFSKLSQPSDTPSISFHTVAGDSVTMARIYQWLWMPESSIPHWDFLDLLPHFDWTKAAFEVIGLSPMFDQIPDLAVFAEQREGNGDICVTVDSAQLPGVPNQVLPIHHGQAFFDEALFAHVAGILGTPLGNLDAELCLEGFIGNRRSRELHDPAHETPQCQLDEIMHRWPFSSVEEAFAEGYEGCAYCMPEHHHE